MTKIALALSLCLAATAAAAQEAPRLGLEAGLSTLGAYVAPGYAVGRELRLRAPLYVGSLSTGFDDEAGDRIEASVDVLSAAVMADYHPGGGAFRVSAGLAFGGYEAEARRTSVTLDGRSFAADFRATLEQEQAVAPVVAAGYRRALGGGWGLSGEFGLRIADLDLSVTGQEALPASERAAFDRSIAGINEDLDAIGVLPFLSIGLSYDF